MTFKIAVSRDVATEIQRVASAQTEVALAGLANPAARGLTGTVFDVRKRCKKARAVVRLVREPLGEKRYRRANAAYRDAARALAGHRDAGAVVAAFELLLATSTPALAEIDVAAVRAGLADRAGAAEATLADVSPALAAAEELLTDAAGRIERWKLDGEGWELLEAGVGQVHGRGRLALASVVKKQTPERLHDLRKQVKYTRYHLRMLRAASPTMVLPLMAQFETVGDQLGEARNLALLAAILEADPASFGGDVSVALVVVAATTRQAELEAAAVGLARRLYAEESDAFAARLGAYWELRQSIGREPAVAAAPIVSIPDPVVIPEPEPEPELAEPEPEPEFAEPEPETEPDVPADDTAPDDEASPVDELSAMTVTALRALAREHEIPGRSRMNRDALLAALADVEC